MIEAEHGNGRYLMSKRCSSSDLAGANKCVHCWGTMMDVLDALLKIAAPEIRFEAYLAFEGEYSSTRKIRTNDCCSLVFVLEGGCDVVFEDDDAVWMSAGDFLLINNNDAYSVVSPAAEHQDQPSAAEKPDDIGKANRPSAGKILCASVVGGNGAVTAFFKLLPDRILLPSSAQSSASPVIRMVKTLHSEVIKKGGGANPIMESFLKCGLILALREMIQLNYSRCGLLSLCGHAMLNRYLCSIVEDPRRGWSLGASEASDHEFSEAEVIEISGFSAATILSLMRVLISFPFLTASKKTILQIGAMVGYNSAAEYSRVFADCIGGPPENFRMPRFSSFRPSFLPGE